MFSAPAHAVQLAWTAWSISSRDNTSDARSNWFSWNSLELVPEWLSCAFVRCPFISVCFIWANVLYQWTSWHKGWKIFICWYVWNIWNVVKHKEKQVYCMKLSGMSGKGKDTVWHGFPGSVSRLQGIGLGLDGWRTGAQQTNHMTRCWLVTASSSWWW